MNIDERISELEKLVLQLSWLLRIVALTLVLWGVSVILEGATLLDLKVYLRSVAVARAMQESR